MPLWASRTGKSTVFNYAHRGQAVRANIRRTVDVKKEISCRGEDRRGGGSSRYLQPNLLLPENWHPGLRPQRAPDLVLNVADSSNLKRSLYLTFQLLEMGAPLIVNLNMTNVAEDTGFS